MDNKYAFYIHFNYPTMPGIDSAIQTSGDSLMHLKQTLINYDIKIEWVQKVEIKQDSQEYRLMTPFEYFQAFGYRKVR